MGTPKAKVSFQLASVGRRPQEEYGIRVDNSNNPFEHVWLQTSEDGSRRIHPLEKHSVMDFINKTASDVEPVKPPPVESTSLKVVQDVKGLKELVAKLCGANEFAVNLKGNQYRSFQGLTCLMQISTRTEDFIVDTLKLRVHIGPYLREVFKDPTKRKVMHGADQCIIWLQRDFGIYVCNMFDTVQASKVLKFEENSLEFLLRHFCKVAAHEEYENADWRLRPLTDEMLRYAREDTHYLLFLYDLMQRRLLLSPTDPECPEAPPLVEVYQRSSDICMQLYQKEISTENSYLNIYGLHAADLHAQQLAIVAELYKWRDATAREVDESTCYILPDKVLIEIAKQMPVTTLKLCHLLKSRHPYIVRNLGLVVTIITNSMQNAVAFEPVAKKLKEEHFDMRDAKNVTVANRKEPAEVAGSESTSNAVEDDTFEKEVGNFEVGANQNHKLGRPQEKYNIRVDNSYRPFEHVWLQRSEDGSRLIHPFEEYSVMDFIDKTVSDVEPVKPPPVETTPFKLVQDVKDLKELATKLRDTDEFSVALKQNQHRSFQGLTCLMQISTRTEDFIVDAFKLRVQIGLYLREVFKDPTKRKVMHGADRCILWLQRDFGIYVCNMFDTGQASKVLKLEEDSLEYLLSHFCEVPANEEYNNADWRVRPLTDAMLRHAREDTHYLLFIYDLMRRRLLLSPTDPERPEAPPVIEVYQRSYNICMQLYQKDILTENSYLNIYGLRAADLNGQQLAIVAGLCELRDYIAREVDESTCYILPDKVLIEIAKKMPVTTLKLCHILKRRHPYIERNLDFVISIITNSVQKAAAFEPAAKKLKEEHIEMIATRNIKFANVEEATEVEGSESTSNVVEDDTFEKKVGNVIVGANQNHKLEVSSASRISIEVHKKPSCAFGAMFGNEAGKRKYNLESKAAEEIKVVHKHSVSLPSPSFTDRTEPSRESDGAIAPDKEATTLFSDYHTVYIPVGDRHIIVETGKIGRQASGSVTIRDGGTIIYTSVCMSNVSSEPSDLLPMIVHYQERLSAAGKTSGGYFKREGRIKDHEVLVCRQIDRALRPTMPKDFYHETQIRSEVWSYDGLHSSDSLAITAAGIAVALSEVPNTNTVAGVRVGLIDDKFVVNPTTMEMKESKLDLLLAGSESGILMIEGYCDFLPEEKLLQAIEVAKDAVRAICEQVDNLVKKHGKPKLLDSFKLPPPELYKHVEEIAGDELVKILQIKDKIPRREALSSLAEKVVSRLTQVEESVVDGEFDEGYVPLFPNHFYPKDVKLVFKRVCSEYLRKQIVKGGKRSDGRTLEEIRGIYSECRFLPSAHGSALFTRGETQSVAVVTLGDKRMAQRIDNLVGTEDVKKFYLQYSFPSSCVGGVGRIGAPSRREIGHGTLAERALKPCLPSEDDFPYTIRVESNITESNGSSSMASVCGGCLALQDAGVPLKSSIAGIAMGLVLDTQESGGDGTPLILSDITGSEDASGDMDLKVAGNEDGVTAFQMDIKVGGITLSTMKQALLQAKEGRKRILAEMLKCSPPPSKKLAKHAPLILVMKVEPDKVNLIIGSGGRNVKSIIKETGVEYVDTQDNGTVKITSRDLASLEKAKAIISNLTMVPIVGDVYRNCKITAVVRFGVFIEIAPGRVGLCHVSELSLDQMSTPYDAFKVGDIVDVKLIKINEKGQLCLSRKQLLPDQGTDNPNKSQRTAGGSNDGGRSGC
ncbi:putative polyribonucleotide nucleotidyltransferase [Helianthus annuus]|uniref:polyribonucleotide nucleotidyltransferase n=1 Tax=Helianthus annuus TaxID=4232 RepID=A0A9K3IMS6_HELAN|nr:uncharacterized protein LOC110914632 isoform X1 [Helianthus annuus]XP_035831122.1 uncharacterized protein LOC110914632 isoform X1 [Helianthus annuus]XP_035831123.1 uncharacterized protein LOC110914632 isoform X1 [Helianthus annuus]XP_035831124.1 uncharacterized protein LOC110914632 isoform X1 [Helianthus annuus]KAF5799366.1 putative polyribonucleotide nucleotidyltransferase [Helianthus annuus]KAJ0550815.1 putative polyribonucleotide nucleotidyltransferase [Helianthus annuus]KAJ0557666.1 pu